MSNRVTSSSAAEAGSVLVPELRFPEFAGQPVQNIHLADATTESTERNGSGQATAQIMGVSKVEGIVPMEERIVAADTARYKFVRKDWFAYNPMRLNIGSIARWQGDDDILVSPDYVVFRCKSSGPHRLDPSYLDHFRRSDEWEDFVSEKGDGSVRVRIYYKDLARLPLALPSFPEQQKIAACLDSADTLIAAQGRKVQALRAHKKGLMKQLFPQEGETHPRLRFPEFEGSGDWEEGVISDIGTVLQGYGFPERYQGQQSGDFPFYKVSDISRSLGAGKTFIEEAVNYVNASQLKELRAKPIPSGTTVFAKIGEAIRSNKRAITTVPCLIDNNAAGVKSIRGKATDFFIYLMMEQISLIDHAGGVVPAVNKSAIEAMPVRFPKVDEQQRIADCLTSLDDLIAAATRKLDTLKTHKKGLMQQLFPKVGESDA